VKSGQAQSVWLARRENQLPVGSGMLEQLRQLAPKKHVTWLIKPGFF